MVEIKYYALMEALHITGYGLDGVVTLRNWEEPGRGAGFESRAGHVGKDEIY